jgi:threonine synthase
MPSDKMIPFRIVCQRCGRTLPKDRWYWQDSCGGALDIIFDFKEKSFWELVNIKEGGLQRYFQLLPVNDLPLLHAGWTPIISKNIDRVNVDFKLEYLSIGGSFKDRGAYVSMAKARELGATGIIVDSSGNSGISFSLMGLVLGIDVHVFFPKYAPEGKKRLIRLLKAKIHEVEGNRIKVNRVALNAEREGLVYVGHWWNPYFIEGVKTMAYEAYEQIGDVDYIITPVGSGTLLLGLYKGFKELRELRALKVIPKIIAVQASGYAKICEKLGTKRNYMTKSKLADGIAIVGPPRSEQIVKTIKSTGGLCIVVDDREIKLSLRELRRFGFIVEPTSATAYAALKKAIEEDFVEPGNRVLLPLTGSGLKMVDELIEAR